MGRYEMIVAIVAIVMFASVLRARFSSRHRQQDVLPPVEHNETVQLREQVNELKERLKVLERITVDKENSLARQIEELRDR